MYNTRIVYTDALTSSRAAYFVFIVYCNKEHKMIIWQRTQAVSIWCLKHLNYCHIGPVHRSKP